MLKIDFYFYKLRLKKSERQLFQEQSIGFSYNAAKLGDLLPPLPFKIRNGETNNTDHRVTKQQSVGSRHSSVVSSVPTIMWPRVQIPRTPSMLFLICIIDIVMRNERKSSRSAFFDCEKYIPNKTHPTTTSHSAMFPTSPLPHHIEHGSSAV